MASPADAGRNTTSIATAADPWTVNLPASIGSGDLLVVYGRTGGTPTFNLPAGWNWLVQNDTSDASNDVSSVIYRWADGTEGATLSWDLSATAKGASISWRITGAANIAVQAPETPAAANSTTAANSCDPPNISPTGGSKDYLFIVLGGLDGEGQTFAHSVYVNDQTQHSGTSSTAPTNCVVGGATRQATVSSENPAAWTHGAASTGTSAWTIAVHPWVAVTKTGGAISPRVGSGTEEIPHDPVTYEETGGGRLGTVVHTLQRAGSASMPLVAGGVSQKVSGGGPITKAGAGVAALTGTASDALLWPETGSGVLPRTGTAADALTWTESGAAVSPRAASAPDAFLPSETGAGITARVASGADVSLFPEAGSGVLVRSSAGADAIVWVESGSGVSPRAAGGVVQRPTISKTGTAVLVATGAGADASLFPETGSGVLSSIGSGVAVKSGGATYTKVGLGQMGVTQAPTTIKSGSGILALVGSGVEQKIGAILKSGSGVSARVGSGADVNLFNRERSGISTFGHFEQGAQMGGLLLWDWGVTAGSLGAKQVIFGELGSGILTGSGGGTETKAGAAEKTGSGIAGFVGAGTDNQTFPEKGAGASPRVGAGADAATFNRSGSGVLSAVGSGQGTKAGQIIKTGSGVSVRASGGATAVLYTEAGAGVLVRNASGTDAQTYPEKGVGISPRVGSGSKQVSLGATYAKLGSGISTFTGSGVKVRLAERAGTSVLARTASGAKVRLAFRSGSAILSFTAAGEVWSTATIPHDFFFGPGSPSGGTGNGTPGARVFRPGSPGKVRV